MHCIHFSVVTPKEPPVSRLDAFVRQPFNVHLRQIRLVLLSLRLPNEEVTLW